MIQIVAYGGLCDSIFKWLGSGLLMPLQTKYGNKININYLSWTDGLPEGHIDIFIGHSFGGNTALNMAKQYIGNPSLVLTLDPRSMTCDFTDDSFQYDPQAISCMNYYRKGWMPGYTVNGSMNTELDSSITHLQVPYQPEVFTAVCSTIEKLL